MKANRTLCCILTSLILAVPFLGGCAGKQNSFSQNSVASIIAEDNDSSASGTDDNSTENSGDTESADESESSENESSENTESTVSTESDTGDTSKTESSSSNTITPAMWKAESKDGSCVYMLGTIHATDESGRDLPDYFEEAFDYCDAIAVEADVTTVLEDPSQAFDMVYKLMYTDGETIKEHLSDETYNALVKLFKSKGLYMEMYDTFKPMMWMSLAENAVIDEAGLDSTQSIDGIVTNRAKEENKDVIELESVDFQIDAFDSLSDGILEALFSSYTTDESYQNQVASMKETYEAWKSGTLSESIAGDYDMYDLTDEEKALYEEYNKVLLVDRNAAMAEKTEKFLEDGDKVLVCVGAAHYYGDDGIVSLLEKEGYTVTRLS